MIDAYAIAAIVIAFTALAAFCVGRLVALTDSREQRAHEARVLRTHDVAALAEKTEDVNAALLKHEERICALELTSAGAPRPRR